MKSWRESEPAIADSGPAPLSLRHILGAPPAANWWSRHRNILWSVTGWLTSAAVVVSASYLLWAMMFRHTSDADPFLGLPRPRATSTTAPTADDVPSGVVAAEAVKVARPEPLTVATMTGSDARSTTVPAGGGTGGGSGTDRGPDGPASPSTTAPGPGATTSVTDDDDGGGRNRGSGGGSSRSTTSATTATTQPMSTPSTATTRDPSSTSTDATDDDNGGGSGSGSGSGGSGKG